MRFLRIFIFSFINVILFIMFKSNYDIIYQYYFGGIVYIPVLPIIYIYIPLFLFQFTYQLIIIYELIFKKFLTKKINLLFIIPIILILITLTKSPYDDFKDYKLPNFKIQELMFRIQTNLEEYRVKTKYYPKTKDRFFKNIISNIDSSYLITNYTLRTKKQKINIIYKFDENLPYIKNVNKYLAPAIVVNISSNGKKYWITGIIKDSFIKGTDIILSYNSKPFILKEEILIRDGLRNNRKKENIYNELIKSFKKK